LKEHDSALARFSQGSQFEQSSKGRIQTKGLNRVSSEKAFGICAENLLLHELNGLQVKIVKSNDRSKTGLQGRILRETKKVFEIGTKKGVKKIQKRECVFEFEIGGKKVRVDGKLLEARPEDRIKVFSKKIKV